MAQVLEDIRVLDLSEHISGPYCGLLLADLGAEVIRIDPPGGTDDRKFGPISPTGDSYHFIGKARNKKGVTLDVFSQRGREVFYQLVSKSDIVVENFTVPAKKKCGVDYESLIRVNPAIILVSISGFGLTGPNAYRNSFDATAQAFSGAMSVTGYPDGPPTRCGLPWVDYSTALHAAVGALAALRYCDKTGKGQLVDISLVDSAFNLIVMQGAVTEHRLFGIERTRIGNRSRYGYANSFQAKDGWVFVSIIRDSIWRRASKAIGRKDLTDDPRFATVSGRQKPEHRDMLDEIFASWVSGKTCSGAIDILLQAKVPCTKVNTVTEAIAEPQIASRGIIAEVNQPGVGNVPVCGTVIKLSETPCQIQRPTPLAGEHNEEIYCGLLRYSKESLAELQEAKII